MGEFDEEAFAVHAAVAEAGEGLDEAYEGMGLLLEGLNEGGGVEAGEDLADAEGGDLLGGLVDFAVFIFAEEVEKEVELCLGVFAALLLGKPDEVAGFFPAGEVAFIEVPAVVAELLNDLSVGDTAAERLVEGLANLGGEERDFVPGEAGEGGEVAGDGFRRLRGRGRSCSGNGLAVGIELRPELFGELGADGIEAGEWEGATEPELDGEMFGVGVRRDGDASLSEEAKEERPVGKVGQGSDGEESVEHARRELGGMLQEGENGIGESVVIRGRLRQVGEVLEEVVLKNTEELARDARFDFVEENAQLEVEG